MKVDYTAVNKKDCKSCPEGDGGGQNKCSLSAWEHENPLQMFWKYVL